MNIRYMSNAFQNNQEFIDYHSEPMSAAKADKTNIDVGCVIQSSSGHPE